MDGLIGPASPPPGCQCPESFPSIGAGCRRRRFSQAQRYSSRYSTSESAASLPRSRRCLPRVLSSSSIELRIRSSLLSPIPDICLSRPSAAASCSCSRVWIPVYCHRRLTFFGPREGTLSKSSSESGTRSPMFWSSQQLRLSGGSPESGSWSPLRSRALCCRRAGISPSSPERH